MSFDRFIQHVSCNNDILIAKKVTMKKLFKKGVGYLALTSDYCYYWQAEEDSGVILAIEGLSAIEPGDMAAKTKRLISFDRHTFEFETESDARKFRDILFKAAAKRGIDAQKYDTISYPGNVARYGKKVKIMFSNYIFPSRSEAKDFFFFVERSIEEKRSY